MSKVSSAASDPAVKDLEKGAGLKTAAAVADEEEAAVVIDARKAALIKIALDAFFILYLLFFVGTVAVMVMVSENWWDSWPGVLIISPVCVVTLWMTPMMKDIYIGLYATKKSSGRDGGLSARLLS